MRLTAGMTASKSAEAYHYEAIHPSSRFGLELSSTMAEELNRFEMELRINTGTWIVRGQIVYNPGADTLSYLDSGGNTQVFASNVKLYSYNYLFNTFKLVLDQPLLKYSRCVVNDVEYDLSAYDLYASPDTTGPHMEAIVKIVGAADDNYGVYIDDVIITQNEP